MNTKTSYSKMVALLAMLFSAQLFAATEMPRLQFGIGDVKAIAANGDIRPLKKGDVLLPGEKLVTGPGAMAQLRLFKQGVVVLRDASQLELQKPVDGKYGVALDKGLLRTVTRLGFRLGKIDVKTPGAEIAVQSGDMLTGVGVDQSSRATTHSHVFDGLVKIRTSNEEKVAEIGKIFQVNPIGGAVTVVDRVPPSMKLTLPAPSAKGKAVLDPVTNKGVGGAFDSDMTKIAVLKPGTPTVTRPRPATSGFQVAVPTPSATAVSIGARGSIGKATQPVKVNYDAVKVFDPRITTGSGDDIQAVKNALIVSIPSSISDTRSFAPVTTTDPAIKKSLTTQATVVTLTPTTKVAGETTLSSPQLPVKVVTFEPTRIVDTSTNFNPELVKTITTTPTTTTTKTLTTTVKTPIKTTTCLTCTKSLTLIGN